MGQVFMKLPPLYTGQMETNEDLKQVSKIRKVKVFPIFWQSRRSIISCVQLRQFLDEENGTVAVSEAKCFMDRVDISLNSPSKKFSNMVYRINRIFRLFLANCNLKRILQFLDAAVALTNAADKDPIQQDMIFRDFVKEFGTHFSKNTWMGVKVYAERRYSQVVYKEIHACKSHE